MSKFDAGTAVDPMEVDFSKFGGPVGDIPEPSGRQVELYIERMKDLRKRRGALVKKGEELQNSGDEEAIDKFLEEIDDETLKSESKQIYSWVQEVTSDFLQADMLENLPPRIWGKFLRWFSGEMNPKADE